MNEPVSPTVRNAMSVDVEDYFQVSAFEGVISRDDWDAFELRVEDNTRRLMDLFAEFDTKATFFILGWVAERCPKLVQDLAAAGHEIASHGYEHRLVHSLDAERFRADLAKAKAILEDAAQVEIQGFRAPSFSITPDTLWAYDVMREGGYRYSSSVFPVAHDRYGMPDFPRRPVRLTGNDGSAMWEVPMTTWRVLGRNLPVAGGGWMRVLPPALMKRGMRAANRDGNPAIVYLHPWEVDPDQPRISGAKRSSRMRHYVNLRKTLSRVRGLLESFSFGTVSEVIDAEEERTGTEAVVLSPSSLSSLVAR